MRVARAWTHKMMPADMESEADEYLSVTRKLRCPYQSRSGWAPLLFKSAIL